MLNQGRQDGIDSQELFKMVRLWKAGLEPRPTILKKLAILIRSKTKGPAIRGLDMSESGWAPETPRQYPNFEIGSKVIVKDKAIGQLVKAEVVQDNGGATLRVRLEHNNLVIKVGKVNARPILRK